MDFGGICIMLVSGRGRNSVGGFKYPTESKIEAGFDARNKKIRNLINFDTHIGDFTLGGSYC